MDFPFSPPVGDAFTISDIEDFDQRDVTVNDTHNLYTDAAKRRFRPETKFVNNSL